MTHTLREVARDKDNVNQLFAERLESEVMSEYMLLALFAEMSMDQSRAELLRERAALQRRSDALGELDELDEEQEVEQALAFERIYEIGELVQQPPYVPMSQFSARAKAMEAAKETVGTFQVVGPQRPVNN